MTITDPLRNAELADLARVLKAQHDLRYDVVAPSDTLRYEDGNLIVTGTEAILTADGVTQAETCLTPTDIFEDGIAQRLNIPRGYIRKMRDAGAGALLDANINEWLMRSNKSWFVRGFKPEVDDCGIARAFLSDRYGVYDNLDVLLAALDGIRKAGVNVKVAGADLTERRMTVRIEAPEIAALAPDLLKGYRSPFTGETGAENPTVFAGFIITNSEVGNGAFTIVPRIVVQVCRNGMTINKDALRKVHLGSKMDEGVVRWSDETNRINTELVTSQAKDAVTSFCNVEYVRAKIAEMEAEAGVEVRKPAMVIEKVSKDLAFTEDESEGILDHFIRGGQMTAGGVMQGITSFAQTVADPDRANALEESALQALSLAAAAATRGE